MLRQLANVICISTLPLLSLTGCAESTKDIVNRDQLTYKKEICDAGSLLKVREALKRLSLSYHLSKAEDQLTALKRYEGSGLISTAIQIEVYFDKDGKINKCNVQVLHTGP